MTQRLIKQAFKRSLEASEIIVYQGLHYCRLSLLIILPGS